MSDRRYRRRQGDLTRPPSPLSSRCAARAWLRQSDRPRPEVKLLLQALGLAMRLKRRHVARRKKSERERRREASVRRAIERLKAKNPDIIADVIYTEPSDGWHGETTHLQGLLGFKEGRRGYNRFARAMSELSSDLGSTPVTTLAPTVMGLAVRAARLTPPKPIEAAVLAVAIRLDMPARTDDAQEQLIDTWKKRYALVAPRVRDLLLAYPLGMKHAVYFVDGAWVPRRGGKRVIPE